MSMASQEAISPNAGPLRDLIDRAAITRVLNDWGLWRDTGRWDLLRTLYAPNATMRTTWFAGPASEFVDRSIVAARQGARAQHFIGAASIDIRGDRAVAETRMILMVRTEVQGAVVDVTCYGRFHDRFVRHGDAWQIAARVPIYEKDRLDPLDPSARVLIDPAQLARYAEGYRHLAYVQSLAGAALTPGLPTPGSAEEADLYAKGAAWLGGS